MLSITKAQLSLPDAYKTKGVYPIFFKEKYKEQLVFAGGFNATLRLGKLQPKTFHESNRFSRYSHTFDSFYMNLVVPRTLRPYNFHPVRVIVKVLATCRAYVQKGSNSM